MNACPPCHGECHKGKVCPAEHHPAYDAWAEYYKSLQIDIKATRFMFARSSHGKSYRAGYNAGIADAKKIVKSGEEWRLWDNDQA